MSKELAIVDYQQIQSRIFTLRGLQVMIDRDLAELYGVENKRLNEQVKRNIERFPEKFRFQLSKQEKDELVANCDRFNSLKHSSALPYAFTEQGVSMKDLGKKWFAFSKFDKDALAVLGRLGDE